MKKGLLITALLLGLGASSAQSKDPSTLNVVVFGDWSSFDPAYCYDTGCQNILYNTLEGLLGFDGGKVDKLIPMLASEVPTVQNGGISKDGKTYTFKIRKGVKFQNGTPLTAQDVEYSLERMMVYSTDVGPAGLLLEPLLGSAELARKGKVSFADIDKAIEVKGDTVVFTLKKAYGPFLSTLASYGFIYSKAEAIKNGDWDGTAATWEKFNNAAEGSTKYTQKSPIGTGPFLLERYDPGKIVILKRNDTYWRTPAKLNRVIIESIKDDTARIQKLATGDADYGEAGAIPSALLGEVRKLPGMVVKAESSLSLSGLCMTHKINGEGTNYLGSEKLDGKGIPINFFSDKNLRKGFAYSVDYDVVLRDILQNLGTQQNSVMIKGLLGYSASSPKYKFDKAVATKYFKQAWGGKVWSTGFTFPVFFNSGNSTRQRVLEMLKKNVESLNPKFKIEVKEIQFSQLLSQSAANKLTMWLCSWNADYPDPHTFAQPFLSSNGNYPQKMNYKNPTLDKLIDQAVAETNTATRVQLYQQISKLGFEETPLIPMYQSSRTFVNRDWVMNRVLNPIQEDYYYPVYKK
ncbi:MAG: ABC transporter substrate-binding protein [Deinococcaceae bacterium]